MNRGVLYAFAAYFLWGVFPLYWKLIQDVPALEIIAHRILWAFLVVFIIILINRDVRQINSYFRNWKILLTYLITGILLAVNWLVYVWAVNAGLIVDASLGYFINPLFNVVLGVLFLQERLRIWQWVPVGIAAFGVLYLTVSYGSLPWIGLVLAFTFGLYGLLKKTAVLNSLHGFTLETGFLFIPALVYLFALEYLGVGSFPHGTPMESMLLMLTGLATCAPLLLFGTAARKVPLSTLGFIQYVAPTLQLLIGVLVFDEIFDLDRMIGYGLIWLALMIYSVDSIRSRPHVLA